MVALVVAIIFFVAAVVAVGVAMTGNRTLAMPAGVTAFVCAALGVVILVVSCYDRVDTRNVGILTAFGRPVGVHGAGIVWHAPWIQVHELSEAIQLQSFESGGYDDAVKGNASPGAGGPSINVRLANNSNAYVDINLNWRIREGAAAKMFQDYGGGNVFDTIRQQLVDRQAQVMASKVFATFNPQTQAMPVDPASPGQPVAAPGVVPTPMQGADLPKMADQVKRDLQDAVGQEIEILDVRIPRLWYDGPTQQRIDQFNQNVQDTLNSAQKVKTAEQEAAAAQARAHPPVPPNQPPPDPTVAIITCVMKAADAGRDAAGCWGQIGGQPLIQIPRP